MTELDTAEMMAIAAAADEGTQDTPQGVPQDTPQEPAAPDYDTEARGAVDMFAALVVGYAPAAESVWTEPAKARTAAALAPVMEKYGFSFGSLPPELTLMIVAGPLLWQSSRLVAAQMAAERAKAKAAKPAKVQAAKEGADTAPAPEVAPQMAPYENGGQW